MRISSLSLQHFRSYTKKKFTFDAGMNVIVGENAKGKTNILEALTLLTTGTSFRAQKTEDMVQWEYEVGRVSGEVLSSNNLTTLEVVLTTGLVQGERAQKRKYLVDDVSRRRKDLIGNFTSVLFRPEDLDMISDGPSIRRRYLDNVLSIASLEYRSSLDSYEKALKRRNALLDVLREGNTTRTAFMFWDQLLIKHGNVLTNYRRDFIDFLNQSTDFPMTLRVEYDPSTVSEKRLHQYAIEEVAAGYTLVGPHKDDFAVYLTNGHEKHVGRFGSRGEQRMAVLWLKMQEMAYIEKTLHERPVLLLDDMFSELDEKHQEMIGPLMDMQQTILTTTENRMVIGKVDEVIHL